VNDKVPEHLPVMVAETLEHLAPWRGGIFVDCTVGLLGHARALVEAGASRVIGLDRDQQALAQAREILRDTGSAIEVVHADYRGFEDVLNARGIGQVDGVLADLGVSSLQLDAPGRGFSFRRDDALDMRMDTSSGPTAAELLASVDEKTLADVIYELGEERHARRVARAIVEARKVRPIETSGQLAEIVRRAIPRKGFTRIDPATRTFQAIRIWVNRELEGLDGFLTRAAQRLAPGGRIVILTFHSLEDRIVKHTFRALQAAGTIVIRTKRPVVPSEAEIDRNPRARSAKLRAAERPA
jgi:16S rRNA (cytosine1402-N4)-methyltransferase